ncbi:MAG: radical SAM protein [Deltaproteobacteria bacterium]|nr:radical SAM protein [Deltaproteobacteria bacterium]
MKPVALFLNPPGARVTMRDDICSSFSKVGYAWPSIDFICQSGYLDPHFELRHLDASSLRWSVERTLSAVASMRPSLIYALVGSVALGDDLAFAERLTRVTDATLVIGGDWPQFHAREALERLPNAFGAVTDFTASGLCDAVVHGSAASAGLATRTHAAVERKRGRFDYPMPRHDLFTNNAYRMPFLTRPFASILTAYGCPYACTFCNSGSIGFAQRDDDGLFRELDELERQGFRSIYVKDFSFNADAPRAKRLLGEWRRRGYRFTWTGFFRGEKIDVELAALLRETGCRMAQIGIETANDAVLGANKPAANLDAVNEGVARLRDAGVAYGAHFVFGLPGDDEIGFRRTLRWAKGAGLAYASFNAFTPRPGTALAKGVDFFAGVPTDSRVGIHTRSAHRDFYRDPRSWWSAIRSSVRSGSLVSLAAIVVRRFRRKGADAWVAS